MIDIHADDGLAFKSNPPEPDTLTYTFSFHGENFEAYLNFTENPNEFSMSGPYKRVETSNMFGMDSTVIYNYSEIGDGNWSILNNILTIQYKSGNLNGHSDNGKEYEILDLNESMLQLKENYDLYQIGHSHPYLAHIKATVYATYEKQ